METVDLAVLVIVIAVFLAGYALGCWRLYVWSLRIYGCSRGATAVLSFVPVANFFVWFPLVAGRECGWSRTLVVLIIVSMFVFGVFGWSAMLLLWLNDRKRAAAD